MAPFETKLPDITITLPATAWLAIAAALRVMDDDMLDDEGILPGVSLQEGFEAIDDSVSEIFGDDWPVLVTTQERLDMEEDERLIEDGLEG